jgi:hypothetical protein
MSKIEMKAMEQRQRCWDVLLAASLAHRLPLSLSELAVLVPWSGETDPYMVVRECESFLTTEGETVKVSHKSATDYLKNHQSTLCNGAVQGHTDIVGRSITAMSLLKRDIYGLRHWGFKSKDTRPPKQDSLASIWYSCVFWLQYRISSTGLRI